MVVWFVLYTVTLYKNQFDEPIKIYFSNIFFADCY